MSGRKNYTKRVHAERLIKVLEKVDTCNKCPGAHRFHQDNSANDMWTHTEDSIWSRPACAICKSFVGMHKYNDCPCIELGHNEAVKRSWLALEEKGYI